MLHATTTQEHIYSAHTNRDNLREHHGLLLNYSKRTRNQPSTAAQLSGDWTEIIRPCGNGKTRTLGWVHADMLTVMQRLESWQRSSAHSHSISVVYMPLDFKTLVLRVREQQWCEPSAVSRELNTNNWRAEHVQQ